MTTRGPETRLDTLAAKFERLRPTKPFEGDLSIKAGPTLPGEEPLAGETKITRWQETRSRAGALLQKGRSLIPIGHKETRIGPRQGLERDTQTDAEQYLEEQGITDPEVVYGEAYEALRDFADEIPVDSLAALPEPVLQMLIDGNRLLPYQIEELAQTREIGVGTALDLDIPFSVAREIDQLDIPAFLRRTRTVDDPEDPEEYDDYINQQRSGLEHVIGRLYNIRYNNGVEKASIEDYLTRYRVFKSNPVEKGDIGSARNVISRTLCVSRVSPDADLLKQLQNVLPVEDYEAIHQEFLNLIRLTLDRHQLPRSIGKTFPEDAEWLNQWDEYFQTLPDDATRSPAFGRSRLEDEPLPEASTLFTGESPFQGVRFLGDGLTGQVYLTEYNPTQHVPKGLGQWVPQQRFVAETAPTTPGAWTIPIEPGQKVAVKIAFSPDEERARGSAPGYAIPMLTSERWALVQCDKIFRNRDPARPAELLGFGVNEDQLPYLAMEVIEEPFERLDNYLNSKGGNLTEQEALEIGIHMADFFNLLHRSPYGLIQNDQNLENFFWDPTGKRLRVIDFGNVTAKKAELSEGVSGFYSFDRQALARNLFQLTTGRQSPQVITLQDVQGFSPEMQSFFQRVFIRGAGGYLSYPDGTRDLWLNLRVAQAKLTGQGTNQLRTDLRQEIEGYIDPTITTAQRMLADLGEPPERKLTELELTDPLDFGHKFDLVGDIYEKVIENTGNSGALDKIKSYKDSPVALDLNSYDLTRMVLQDELKKVIAEANTRREAMEKHLNSL